MKKFLKDYELKNDLSYLPLVHTTKLAHFLKIVENGELSPMKEDEVTSDNLLFFFYGRAVYTIHWDGAKKRNSLDNKGIPVAIIFEVCDVPDPDYIYAFDSGGFQSRKYKEKYVGACEIDSIDSFSLDCYVDIKKLIDLFYLDTPYYNKNHSYLNERPIDHHDFGNEVLNKYLICLNKGDDRKTKTPEISFKKNVPISKCKAIILPKTVIESGIINNLDILKNDFKIDVLSYYDYGNLDSHDLCDRIETIMGDYVGKGGYLKK